jgi:beta-1,4-mannosyl-glycoprotein beta-1,4-N-acetylglucosaminyltransferase
MKIVDCFIFYNELEMLQYRFDILDEVVDYFIVVESTHTFNGKEKPLHFAENAHLYEKYRDKIIVVTVNDMPYKYPNINVLCGHQWINEQRQRNHIDTGLQNMCSKPDTKLQDEDIVLISDLDEIPDPQTLQKIKNNQIRVTVNILDMYMYYYNLNTRHEDKWLKAKVLTYKAYKTYSQAHVTCDQIRTNIDYRVIPNGGWHLSYFGDAQFIKNKIAHFSHQDLNVEQFTNADKINERIKNCADLYDRDLPISKIPVDQNDYLPPLYRERLANFIAF